MAAPQRTIGGQGVHGRAGGPRKRRTVPKCGEGETVLLTCSPRITDGEKSVESGDVKASGPVTEQRDAGKYVSTVKQ